MHRIPQQPQRPENRHDSAERPRPDSWEDQSTQRLQQGFSIWWMDEPPERWTR